MNWWNVATLLVGVEAVFAAIAWAVSFSRIATGDQS